MIYTLLRLLLPLSLSWVWAQTLPFPIPSAGSVTFTDDFQRPDESPLSKGGAWVRPVGASLHDVNLVSHLANGGTAGNNENMAMILTPTFPANQRASITYQGGQYSRVWARLSNSGGYAFTTDQINVVQFFKAANNGTSLTYVQMGSNITIGRNLIAGDILDIEVTGTTINGYLNGVLVGTRTDSTYATGQPGLGSFGSINIASNFSATSIP